jgi:hypothetical protein
MPAYWLAISYAAYRALWQLMSPYYWEKTEHAGRRAAEKEAIIAAGSEEPDLVASGEKA